MTRRVLLAVVGRHQQTLRTNNGQHISVSEFLKRTLLELLYLKVCCRWVACTCNVEYMQMYMYTCTYLVCTWSLTHVYINVLFVRQVLLTAGSWQLPAVLARALHSAIGGLQPGQPLSRPLKLLHGICVSVVIAWCFFIMYPFAKRVGFKYVHAFFIVTGQNQMR